MENKNHEQGHAQNTEIGNYGNYAPSNASASSSGYSTTSNGDIFGWGSAGAPQHFTQVNTSQPITVQIGQAVGGVATWSNTSGPIADWYYEVNTDTGTAMSRGVTTRIVNPELDGLKDTVATLKKELEEMKEKLKTTNNESHEEHRKLGI